MMRENHRVWQKQKLEGVIEPEFEHVQNLTIRCELCAEVPRGAALCLHSGAFLFIGISYGQRKEGWRKYGYL